MEIDKGVSRPFILPIPLALQVSMQSYVGPFALHIMPTQNTVFLDKKYRIHSIYIDTFLEIM